MFLNECHIASAKQIFAPELIPAKINGDKMKSLSLFTVTLLQLRFYAFTLLLLLYSDTKTNKILFSDITRYSFIFTL